MFCLKRDYKIVDAFLEQIYGFSDPCLLFKQLLRKPIQVIEMLYNSLEQKLDERFILQLSIYLVF